jgi:hypothetical protein
VSDDEDELGEQLFNAPLPAYERSWMHPSEHARQDDLRSPARFDRSTVRTLALFSILTCLATSVGLLVVSVPDSPEVTSPSANRNTLQPGISPLGLNIARVSAPIAAAVAESGLLIGVIDGAAVGETVHVATPEATEFDAVVVNVEPELGVSLLKVVEGQTTGAKVPITPTAKESVNPGAPVWIATKTYGVELSHISSSTSGRATTHIPLEPFAASHHGGTVFDDEGTLLGWCVERDGSHWLLPVDAARSAVLRLDGDVEQP